MGSLPEKAVQKGTSLVKDKIGVSSGTRTAANPTAPSLGKAQNESVTRPGGAAGTLTEVKSTTGPAEAQALSVAVDPILDAYRSGGFSAASVGGDSLLRPRVLGEGEDRVAYLSITQEINDASNLTDLSSGSVDFRGNVVSAYSRFFLQSVSESQVEKYQVVETFSSFYTFFYGKRPAVYRFTGILLNDENHKWVNDFMFFYENYFRGTRTTELNSQAVMTYDGRMVSGFIVDLSLEQASAPVHKGVMFSMNMLITDHVPVTFSSDMRQLISSASTSLRLEAERLARQLATINREIPAAKAYAVRERTTGKKPNATFTAKNEPKKPARPGTVKKGKTTT